MPAGRAGGGPAFHVERRQRDRAECARAQAVGLRYYGIPGIGIPHTSGFNYIEPPEDDEWLYALRDAGFTDIQMDIDVYDNDERRTIMPNAKGNRPIEAYERAFLKAKQIFPGEVATQLVAGIQKDENLLAGVERFAGIGIPTLVTPFLPFGQGAKLAREEGIEVPNADKMWRVYEASANHLVKNGVPAPQFRGGVSSLPEVMGRRHKRAAALTNTVRRSSVPRSRRRLWSDSTLALLGSPFRSGTATKRPYAAPRRP